MNLNREAFQAFITDLDGAPVLAPGSLRVSMLSWKALGGCDRARLVLDEAPGNFAQWSGLISKAVRVYNSFGCLVWWGYIHSAAREEGAHQISQSLDDLANRVAVRYLELEPTGESFGAARQTEWAEDAQSTATFGRKDLLLERGLMSESAALQLRDLTLARSAEPAARLLLGKPQQRSDVSLREERGRSILLDCMGWFARLAWRIYQPPNGLLGNTASQQGSQSLGNTSSFQRVGQSFRTASSAALLKQVEARVRRYGSPSDSIKLALQLDNGSGSPTGVDLVSALVSGASLAPEAYPWTVFSFADPPQLLADTNYWLVFSRSGSVSASNYYVLAVDEKLSYLDGTLKTYNGSAWSARSMPADLVFRASAIWQSTDLLAEAAGLFLGDPFSEVSVDCASGVFLTPTSAMPLPTDQFARSLLDLGTERMTTLTCEVDANLRLIFSERVAAQEGELWKLNPRGGLLTPAGEPPLPGQLPVGRWLRSGENAPVFITAGAISAPDWTPRLKSD